MLGDRVNPGRCPGLGCLAHSGRGLAWGPANPGRCPGLSCLAHSGRGLARGPGQPRALPWAKLFGPFRARACMGTGQPRAMPWAKLFGPFRAKTNSATAKSAGKGVGLPRWCFGLKRLLVITTAIRARRNGGLRVRQYLITDDLLGIAEGLYAFSHWHQRHHAHGRYRGRSLTQRLGPDASPGCHSAAHSQPFALHGPGYHAIRHVRRVRPAFA